MRGYKPGRFSFNVRGGRCEACQGDGIIQIEMHFLPDVYVPCEVCHGTRYSREVQEVKFRGHSISDVLEMTVDEAYEVFENVPRIQTKLKTLRDVGLGYIRLGQPATQLSGGEAQRVKLSSELSRRDTGRTLYLLDEPTTGLHYADVERLLVVLHRLVEHGNTVVVIEHNLDVLKTADWIIDLGPEGGEKGGYVIAEGTPEQLASNPASSTGQFLRTPLERAGRHVKANGAASARPAAKRRVKVAV
jgi:excinuclease ABC subunit A